MIKWVIKIIILIIILTLAFVGYKQFTNGDAGLEDITGEVVSDLPSKISEGTDKISDMTDDIKGIADDAKDIGDKIGISEKIKDTIIDTLGITNTKDTVGKIMNLREHSKSGNTIKTAKQISDLNVELKKLQNSRVNNAWQDVLGCAYNDCEDEKYLELIDAVASLKDNKENSAIAAIIDMHTSWTKTNPLYFSETLTKTDEAIKGLDNSKISSEWKELVECDGNCADFGDMTIGLIEQINSAQ